MKALFIILFVLAMLAISALIVLWPRVGVWVFAAVAFGAIGACIYDEVM